MDKELQTIQAERKEVRKQLSRIRYFVRGSIMECERTCGKPTCKCAKGQKHIAYYLSLKKENKTLLIYLPRSSLKLANKWIDNHKKLKELIDKLLMLNIEVLKSKPQG